MKPPFFTQKPYAIPSMNRVRMMDLPGLDFPESCKGKFAFHLLSTAHLKNMVLGHNDVLGLDANSPDLLRAFDGCFTAVSAQVRATAKEIAEEYGRFLAYLLLTLKRGDAINRAARADWRDVHWEFWAQIEQVYVGGGVLAGHLGAIAIAQAEWMMHEAGFPDFTLIRSPYAAHLPLIGVGRDAPADAQAMLAFDFGQTNVKTAVSHYNGGELVQLTSLPSHPAPCTDLNLNKDPFLAQETFDQMLLIIEKSWHHAQAQFSLTPRISMSVACYMLDGHPIKAYDWGCYGRLQALTTHMQTMFTEQISARLNMPIQVKLHHDGAAAAMVYAGVEKTAVLTFGTAIGNGYPSDGLELRPLSAKKLIIN